MVERQETIEISISGREALISHIQSLQEVITKRNEEIEALKRENEELISDPNGMLERLKQQSWEQGFHECRKYIRNRLADLPDWLNVKDEEMFR